MGRGSHSYKKLSDGNLRAAVEGHGSKSTDSLCRAVPWRTCNLLHLRLSEYKLPISLASCHSLKRSGYTDIFQLSSDDVTSLKHSFVILSPTIFVCRRGFCPAFSWNPNHLAVVWHHSLCFARAQEATIGQQGASTWRSQAEIGAVLSDIERRWTIHWIGWRGNLQEIVVFNVKYGGFRFQLSRKIQWNKGIGSRFHDTARWRGAPSARIKVLLPDMLGPVAMAPPSSCTWEKTASPGSILDSESKAPERTGMTHCRKNHRFQWIWSSLPPQELDQIGTILPRCARLQYGARVASSRCPPICGKVQPLPWWYQGIPLWVIDGIRRLYESTKYQVV